MGFFDDLLKTGKKAYKFLPSIFKQIDVLTECEDSNQFGDKNGVNISFSNIILYM